MFFALASGVFEGAKYATDRFILGRLMLDGHHAVWLPTAFNLVVFGALGLGLAGVMRLLPERTRTTVIVYVFCLVACVAVLGKIRGLHLLAALILAAGVAARATQWIARSGERFLKAIRPITVALALGALLALLTALGTRRLMERRAVASLPTPPSGAPNVLLVVMDTVRAKNLSLYGYPVPTTPNLERYGKYGVVFDRAIATASWTGPSHASMFTGRYPHEMTVDWLVPLDGSELTLAEELSRRGYRTGAFVGNVSQCSSNQGFAQGFSRYDDFHLTSRMQLLQACSLGRSAVRSVFAAGKLRAGPDYRWDKPGSMVAEGFLEWHEHLGPRPFFAFLNFMDPHGPRRGGQASFRGIRPAGPVPRTDPFDPRGELPRGSWPVQLNYNAKIAYTDAQIGRLLDELERRGALESTIVIVTSDHGDLFGEHSAWSHGKSLYLEVLHVPLLVVFPGHIPAGVRVETPVTLRDLPATILSLLGSPGPPAFPGNSLAALWSDPSVAEGPRSPILSEFSETDQPGDALPRRKQRSLFDDGYHYIVRSDGVESLYYLPADPEERTNLAGKEDARPVVSRLRAKLQAALTGSPH